MTIFLLLTVVAGSVERIVIRATPLAAAMLPIDGVTTAEALASACRAARPGDEVVLRDGVYSDWKADLVGAGTKGQPIVIQPQTPGSLEMGNVT